MPEQGASWAKARVPVTWEVASDEKMQKLVKKGSTFATPELGHSVHVDVTGLQPVLRDMVQFNGWTLNDGDRLREVSYGSDGSQTDRCVSPESSQGNAGSGRVSLACGILVNKKVRICDSDQC